MMKKYLLWVAVLLFAGKAFAHPMPSSTVDLSIMENTIRGEARIPLLELGNAVGDERMTNLADPFFIHYFTAHIQAVSSGKSWTTNIENISVATDKDPFVGVYKEVVVKFLLTPPDIQYLRSFTFNYDAVVHQVVTHSALVSVRQDWSNGIHDESGLQQVGIVQTDIPTGKIFPLQINLEQGSRWKGFKSMVSLGMQHIKEGTDHLLFILVLLLPAMLLTNGKRWSSFGGTRYSITHLLKIVTAFTIGHSITLLLGALGWVKLPGQPVEILIAISILVSTIHAIRPIFPGRETYVAAGFGLVHGLAFAAVLANLNLSAGKMALSILGFNIGIEMMQLFVIALIIPWLMLLSKMPVYKWVRTAGAILAGVAAGAWILQRTTGNANFITRLTDAIIPYAGWGIAGLALVVVGAYLLNTVTVKKAELVA